MRKGSAPDEVVAVRKQIAEFLDQKDTSGRAIGGAKRGVYAFYDYDGEPIYVGQTDEMLRSRVRRHLTNQRTDAVAMSVLDPAEVAEIEVWPLFDLEGQTGPQVSEALNAAEYTVFQQVLQSSVLKADLNEKDILPKTSIELPQSFRKRIVPDAMYERLKHPDLRIARRASTIASLARVISEREVSKGLRRTLLTQARRLQNLAEKRFSEIGGEIAAEMPGEETGEDAA